MDARLSGRLDEWVERSTRQDTRIDGLETEMRRGSAEMRVGMAHIVTLLERADDDEGDAVS